MCSLLVRPIGERRHHRLPPSGLLHDCRRRGCCCSWQVGPSTSNDLLSAGTCASVKQRADFLIVQGAGRRHNDCLWIH